MQATSEIVPLSTKTLWAGRILGGLIALLLLADAVAKLFKPPQVVEPTLKLGYPVSVIVPLGVVLLVCALLYLIPRTAVLGAILLTGYLGGAVATHVRAGGTAFEILFPSLMGALLWGGLYLWEGRLRALVPLTTIATDATKKQLWIGRVLSALPVLMLLFSAVGKLMKPAMIVQEFGRLGYSEQVILALGVLELACTAVYLIPRTAVLGAILLTGYLGGAVATHVRIGDPIGNVVGPILFGVLLWGGLWFRKNQVRRLIPLRQ